MLIGRSRIGPSTKCRVDCNFCKRRQTGSRSVSCRSRRRDLSTAQSWLSPSRDPTPRPTMVTDLNPQAKQMADESMVRNLRAQAEAIWPQEALLLRRYALPAEPRILDAGSATR